MLFNISEECLLCHWLWLWSCMTGIVASLTYRNSMYRQCEYRILIFTMMFWRLILDWLVLWQYLWQILLYFALGRLTVINCNNHNLYYIRMYKVTLSFQFVIYPQQLTLSCFLCLFRDWRCLKVLFVSL